MLNPPGRKDEVRRATHTLSSAHRAKLARGLVGQRLGSNLHQSQTLKVIPRRLGVPGSNRINRLAPIRLMPHPPALLLSKNINSFPSGLLNWSTSFCRLLIVIVPSSRKNPYLMGDMVNISRKSSSHRGPLLCTAQLLEQVQSLRIVANQNDLVIGLGPNTVQEPTGFRISINQRKEAGVRRTAQGQETFHPNHTSHPGSCHDPWQRRQRRKNLRV